jgi:hypothetical protein
VHWPHGDPDALARSIVAQPAYRIAPSSSAPPAESLLQALLDYLGHVLKPFFDWLHGAAGSAKPFGLGLGLLLLALALGLVAFAIVRILNALTGVRGGRGTIHARRAGALPTARSAAEWRALAERAAAAADYASAVAALFSAALAALDERALVPFDAARTPGEYRRLLRRAAASAGRPFDVLADGFVRAAFADEPVDADDYTRALDAYDGLWTRAA